MRYIFTLILVTAFCTRNFANSGDENAIFLPSDTIKNVNLIPLSWEDDEFISRYCGRKVTEAICTLNDIYQNLGYIFSLSDHSQKHNHPSVSSFFNFDISDNYCEVDYDIQEIEEYINNLSQFHNSAIQGPPSGLQLNVIRPVDNSVAYFRRMDFEWESTDKADQYLLEISLDKDFEKPYLSSIVFGTYCRLDDLPPDQMIYWRIKPLNFLHYCEEHRASGKTYASKKHVKPITCEQVSVYSLAPPQESSIFIDNPKNNAYEFMIESMDSSVVTAVGTNAYQKIIDVSTFSPGAYFVYLKVGEKKNSTTLIVE